MILKGITAGLAALLLTGCVAEAAYDVVTAPVRIVGKGINAVTTSPSEADRNRGRRERKAEDRQRKADAKAAKEQAKLLKAQQQQQARDQQQRPQ